MLSRAKGRELIVECLNFVMSPQVLNLANPPISRSMLKLLGKASWMSSSQDWLREMQCEMWTSLIITIIPTQSSTLLCSR